jgi:tRNA U34 5-carboxymethylaminomethyl modifying GTPase MnmE/TrmE
MPGQILIELRTFREVPGMKCINKTKTLYKKLETLQVSYDKSKVAAEKKEKELTKKLVQIFNNIDNEVTKTVKNSENINDLKKLSMTGVSHINNGIQGWKKQLENAVTGEAFSSSEKFKDSFLIMVFGEVNTGKSSLMNFLCGKKKGTEELTVSNPEFFHHKFSESGKHIDDPGDISANGFKEGVIETTTSIQGFTMDRLTFIDSPGIHSLNSSNEELTKKYLEAADLVVFTTNSHEAMKKSERKEVLELINAGRTPLIVCTRSDDSGPVPLSVQDREEIASWCSSFIKEDLPGNKKNEKIDVFHISTLLADIALQNGNDDLFVKSGMAQFIEFILETVEKNGLSMKMKGPEKRMLGIANTVNRNINKMKNEMDSLTCGINSSLEDLEKKLADEIPFILSHISLQTKLIVEKHAEAGNSEDLIKELKNMFDDVVKERFLDITARNITAFNREKISIPDDLIEDVEISDITREYVKKQYGGKIGGGIGGAIVGGIIGFFTGGPAGLAIGIGIGSELGRRVGDAFDGETTETIIVGDNRDEVADRIVKKCSDSLKQISRDLVGFINENYYRPIFECVDKIQAELGSVEKMLVKNK